MKTKDLIKLAESQLEEKGYLNPQVAQRLIEAARQRCTAHYRERCEYWPEKKKKDCSNCANNGDQSVYPGPCTGCFAGNVQYKNWEAKK